MIAIKHDKESDEHRAQELGLAPDELAFYDAVAANYLNIYNEAFLRDLILAVKMPASTDGTSC